VDSCILATSGGDKCWSWRGEESLRAKQAWEVQWEEVNEMGKLKWILMLLFVVLCVFLLCLTLSPPPKETPRETPKETPQFQLKEWKVINDDGVPKLQIKFSANKSVIKLTLIDPDGVETDWSYVELGVTGAKLRMSDYGRTPPAGTYTLLIKDILDREVTSPLTFNFSRANLKIINVTPTWEYYKYRNYSLTSLAIKVKNTGDLPAYIDKADISINGEIDTMHLLCECILPKETKTVTDSIYISDISPGNYTLTITLKDTSDTIMATYSTEVALSPPPKETPQFQLKEWKVINDDGVPKLQIKFSATKSVDLTLTDPDGVKTDWSYVELGVTGAKLRMSDYGKTPLPGTYTLIIKDALSGEAAPSLAFNFSGAKLKITDVTPTWEYYKYLGFYSLTSLAIKVRNTGDLPAYINRGELNIDGQTETMYYLTECVLPKETRTITDSVYISGISPGTYTLTITLKDKSGTIMATYNTEVTLS